MGHSPIQFFTPAEKKFVRNVIARLWPEKHDNRGSIVPGKRLVAGVAFFCFDSLFLVAQQPSPELALDEAARAFEHGKTTEAEQKLRPILEKHPSDLLCVAKTSLILTSVK